MMARVDNIDAIAAMMLQPVDLPDAVVEEMTRSQEGSVEDAPQDSEPQPAASQQKLERGSGRKRAKELAPPAPAAGPAYLGFYRKEARMRTDQYEDLVTHARRLNKLKGVGGERITENTLIRVAIDMLLARAGDLRGADEDQLRKSVGL